MKGHIGRSAMMGMISLEVGMGIPFAINVNLEKAAPPIDQAPGHQTFCANVFRHFGIDSVERQGFPGLRGKISEIASLHLHSISQLETLNSRQQVRFTCVMAEMFSIDLLQKIQLGALVLAGDLL